jgi:hypothetical protein
MANGTIAASQLEMESLSGTGIITVTPPATNTNRAITLPDAAGQVVLDSATQTLTNKTIQSSTIQGGALTLATAVASTSGTSIDFTGIPSWVKRITVMFSGVSTNSTSFKQIQLGDSGGFETAGYLSSATNFSASSTGSATATTGFVLRSNLAAADLNGSFVLTLLDSATNTWSCVGAASSSATVGQVLVSGSKSLSDTLTQIRITTVNGTDTFDAGTINIIYEG